MSDFCEAIMSHSKQLSEVNILERLKEAWLILREHIQDTLRGSAIGALIAAAGAFIGGMWLFLYGSY